MRAGAIVGIVAVLLAGGAAVRTSPVGERGPATPEAAVALLVERSRAEDTAGVMELLASPLRELTEYFYYSEATYIESMVALAHRFPVPLITSSGFGRGTWYDMRRLRSAEILRREVVHPDRVRMTVRETVGSFSGEGEDVLTFPYLAVKTRGQWRLFRPPVLLIGEDGPFATCVVEGRPDDPPGAGWRCTMTFHKDLDEAMRDWGGMIAQSEGRSLAELAETQRRAYRRVQEVIRAIRSGEYALREQAWEEIGSILDDEEKRASPRQRQDGSGEEMPVNAKMNTEEYY